MALTPRLAAGGTAAAAARPGAQPAGSGAASPESLRRLRFIDLCTFVYFGINTLLLAHPNRPANWPVLLSVHLVYLVGMPLVIRSAHRHPLLGFLREWYPLLGILFMYSELQYLNRILTDRFFDPLVIDWEQTLFRHQLAVDFRKWFPWKPLGEILHFGYFSYYFNMPALFFPLWFLGRRREFQVSVGVVVGTYYFCYLWYIFFPVTGPYWQFKPFPDPATEGWFFPQLANAVVAGGSSRGSAFPSSHIAASVAVLGMAARYLKPVARVLVVTVTLLCLGTVYGGFHYGVDALGGLVIGFLAVRFGPEIVINHDFRRA